MMMTIIAEEVVPFVGLDVSKALGFLDMNLELSSVELSGYWVFPFQCAVLGIRQLRNMLDRPDSFFIPPAIL